MQSFNFKTSVMALAVTGIVTAAPGLAVAGGFAVREQSTTSQGMSFAGSAANTTLSAMYWNPAAVANLDGRNSESHAAIVLGDSEITVTGGNVLAVNRPNSGVKSGNIAKPALVTSSYNNFQINPNLYVGLSINAPFGLVTEPDNNYAGSLIGRTAKIFNIVGTPTVGVKLAPWLTIGAGVQVAYMDGVLKFGQAGTGSLFFDGDDYGFGWTLGATLEPVKGTRIGIGYRSQIEYKLEGKFGDNNTSRQFAATTELTTPDIITVSLQQDVSDRFRFMATYEWTDWSDFDRLDIIARQSGVLTALAGVPNTLPTGGIPVAGQRFASLETNWKDGWFVSVGFEYDYTEQMTFRAGVAYEKSPIQEASQRLTVVPDNDRVWLSAGMSYKVGQILPAMLFGPSNSVVDLAFTHIFVRDGDIERPSIANSKLGLKGTAETNVNILSFALRTKF